MEGLFQVPQWDFWGALGRPPIPSLILARYQQCLFAGWPGRKW